MKTSASLAPRTSFRTPSSFWLLAAAGSLIGSCLVGQAPAQAVTLADNLGETQNTGDTIGYVQGAINWQAMKFNTTTASVINQVTVSLQQDSTNPATQGTLYLDIYSQSGSTPGSFVGNVGSLNASTVASSFTPYTFSPLSLALSQNTSYFLVARPNNFANDTGLTWAATSSTNGFGFTPPVRARSTDNGSSWFIPGGASYAQLQIQASEPVPGPLPLFGASAAFAWSRRLRRRVAASQ